jgi:type IV pilus assembly protein PilB
MTNSVTILNDKLKKAFEVRHIDCGPDSEYDGKLLSDLLIEQGKADPSVVNSVLEEVTGFSSLDPSMVSLTSEFAEHAKRLIPGHVALREKVFPVKHERNSVHIVMSLPTDMECIRRLESITGSRIKPYCCYTKGIVETIHTYYGDIGDKTAFTVEDVTMLIDDAATSINKLKVANADIMAIVNDVSVIRLLQFVLGKLAGTGASDLHFESQEDSFKIRYRKDGVMQVAWSLPPVIRDGIVSRLKLISGMDIAEKDLPQDGSINYNLVEGKDIDIRASSLPSVHGEKIVLRILERDKERFTLNELGMETKEFGELNQIIRKPSGLILVTGPTGSGKTTTLYAMLNELNTEDVNIITAEDPVEYKLKGLTQVNCTSEKGLTFKDALKSFLRQDPDVIMVGEIRDIETADIAVKSAMTGHIVLSTLHTNDAASAISRLINMGIPPYLVASAQITVIAQRLMRRVCDHCKIAYVPEKESMLILGIKQGEATYYRGEGCDHCSGTGYNGRVGIYELLTLNDRITKLVLENQPSGVIRKAAIEDGMTTLRKAALKKLKQGITTVEEVLRVTMDI